MKASLQDFITKIFTQIKNNFGNVDNTSDADKPISTAQQAEFDAINSNLSQLEYSDVAGGKNLIDFSKISIGYELNDGKLIVNAEWYVTDYIKVKPNTTYTMSGTSSDYVCEYDSNKNHISSSRSQTFTFTTSNTTEYVRINSIISGYDNAMLEMGAIATEYEPYIPSVKMLASENAQQSTEAMDLKMLGWTVPAECPIQNYEDSDGVFHQRVGRVDLGSLNWIKLGEYNYFANMTTLMKRPSSSSIVANIYCSKLNAKSQTHFETENNSIAYFYTDSSESLSKVIVYSTDYTDATTFKNAMQGVYLYYELATEITIKVDGNEAVTKVNDSLGDYNLDNKFDGIWYQAYRDSATSVVSNSGNVCSNVFRCNAGDVVKLNYSNSTQTIYLQFWKSDGSSLIEQSVTGNKLEVVAPQDTSYVSIDISDSGITPQNVGNVTLYIANQIDQLKNDLDGLPTFNNIDSVSVASNGSLSITVNGSTYTFYPDVATG